MRSLTFKTENTKTKRECKVTWYATEGVFLVPLLCNVENEKRNLCGKKPYLLCNVYGNLLAQIPVSSKSENE